MFGQQQSISTAERYAFGVLCLVAIVGFFAANESTGLLLNTLKLAAAVMLVAIPIAAALAYYLTRCSVIGKSFWEACLLILLFIPLYIQLASWEAGFGRGGWYSTLIAAKLSNPPLEGFVGCVWVHSVAAVPWLYWIFRLGFSSVPSTFEESAALDASAWQIFRRVTLPLMLPTCVAACFYVLVIVSTEITVTDRYQYRSYAEVLYSEYVLNDEFSEIPLSVAPIVASLLSVLLGGLIICRLLWPTMVHATVSKSSPIREPNIPATLSVAKLVGILLLVPIGNLIYQAGIEVTVNEIAADAGGVQRITDVASDSTTGVGLSVTSNGEIVERVRSWSAAKLFRLMASSPRQYRNELAYTAILSQLSVIGSVALAVGLAWCARRRRWIQSFNACLATLCFVTPGPFIGLGLIWLLTVDPDSRILKWLYDDTLFAPWMAITIRCFPFAYLIVWYGLRSIPQAVFEAAEADGASSFQSLHRVALPLLVPSLICAGLVGLAISIGELSASILVMPPGVFTVATEIFQLIHYGAEDQLAGLCLSCLMLIVLIAFLARTALNRLATSQI